MPIFTFYPCAADGSALTFQAMELADEGQAELHAKKVLADHASCATVVVWQDERRVLELGRQPQDA